MRWTRFEKASLPLAWLLLGASRLVIFLLPFRWFAHWLGEQFGSVPWIPLVGSVREAKAASVGKVVRAAAALTPWESACLPQAITARILLGLAGIPCSLFLGVSRDRGLRSNAHAWVAAGRTRVTGGEGFGSFTVVGCFVAQKAVEKTGGQRTKWR